MDGLFEFLLNNLMNLSMIALAILSGGYLIYDRFLREV